MYGSYASVSGTICWRVSQQTAAPSAEQSDNLFHLFTSALAPIPASAMPNLNPKMPVVPWGKGFSELIFPEVPAVMYFGEQGL